MAIVHKTTLIPGKLELLASWLPAQPPGGHHLGHGSHLGRSRDPRPRFRSFQPLAASGRWYRSLHDAR